MTLFLELLKFKLNIACFIFKEILPPRKHLKCDINSQCLCWFSLRLNESGQEE